MRSVRLNDSAPRTRSSRLTTRLSGLAVVLALLGGGCESAPTQPGLSTVRVSVAPVALSLTPGQSQALAAAVAGTTNVTVLWQSSAPAVATVTAAGVVTGVSPGTATITATAQADPSSSASAVVTVLPPVIVIAPATTTIPVGGTQQLAATVNGLANVGIVWTSATPSVASVDQAGRVTGIAPGVATIVATSSADATRTATAQITVVVPITVLIAPPNVTVRVGQVLPLTAAVTGSVNTAVTWTTSDATIVAIDPAGTITGVKSGSATVTARSVADPTRAATATITVVPPITISVSPSSAAIQVGQSLQLTGSVAGTSNGGITWATSNPAVVSVSNSGTITGIQAGTAQVTATSVVDPTVSVSVAVNVAAAQNIAVTVSPTSAVLASGATRQLTASVTGTNNTSVLWSSSAPTVATVSATGLVTALNPGTATVFARSAADPTIFAAATISVTGAGVTVTPAVANVVIGASVQLSATTTGSATPAAGLTWSSQSVGVATVDQSGKVTGVSVGTTTIVATNGTGQSGSATVTVSSAPSSAAGLYLFLNAQAIAIGTGSTNTITAWLTDAAGNRVAEAGQVLDWSTSDPGGRLSPASSVTDASGSATTTYTAGTTPYFHTLTAAARGRGFTGSFRVFIAGPPRATLTAATLDIDYAALAFGQPAGRVVMTYSGNVGGLNTVVGYEYSTNATFSNATTVAQSAVFGPDTSDFTASFFTIPPSAVAGFGPDTTYVRLILQNAAGTTRSNALYVTTPDAPSNVRATLGSDHVMTVSWTHSGANLNQGFTVRRRDIASQTWVTIDSPNSRRNTGSFIPANERSVVDSSFDVRTTQTWIYEVTAYNAVGAKSATTQITTARLEPPSALTVSGVTPTTISLSWTDNSSTESEFGVEFLRPQGVWTFVGRTPANVKTFTYTIPPFGDPPGTTYSMRVSALVPSMTNGNFLARASIPSNTVQVTPR